MAGVDVSGVRIDYEVTGEGRPVVLLHGFPDSGRLWRHQAPRLAEAGFQVIVPDLRGYGRSGQARGRRRLQPHVLSPATSSRCSPTPGSSGPTWSATTGGPPSRG